MDFEKLSQQNIDELAENELANNFEREELIEKQFEKPVKLYRGMRALGVEEFDPMFNIKHRDKNEGPVIFATPDKAFASMFLVPEADDSWSIKGRFGNVYYMVIADRERYKKFDKGGSIYEIEDLDDFYCDKNKGMGDCEWVSKKIVKSSKEQRYSSAIEAMIKNGVRVYFVDNETFIKIKNSQDHGLNILQSMQSENQKQNRNIRELIDNE